MNFPNGYPPNGSIRRDKKKVGKQIQMIPTGLIALELLGRFNKVPINIRHITREYGITQDISAEEFVRISRRLGFKTKLKRFPKRNSHIFFMLIVYAKMR
jgi:hypothetical protein